MTGVELILAALAAGAAAGTGDAAKAAVLDAYTQLREMLRGRMAGRQRAQQVLDGVEDDGQARPVTWQADLEQELVLSGAADDGDVLAAARRLLTIADPGGVAAGKYRIGVDRTEHVHIGDTTIDAPYNQGAVGTFHAPVTFGGRPDPPVGPGAA